MGICDFNPSIIKELDNKAAKLIKAKAGILSNSGNTLLYAPLKQRGLGLIKLVDKMTNIKITGKFRQLKGNSIAELMLRYTLLNRKQNNSDRMMVRRMDNILFYYCYRLKRLEQQY